MYFPISLLMDILAVSAFWLTLIRLLQILLYSYLGEYYVCISAGNAGNDVELLGHWIYIF